MKLVETGFGCLMREWVLFSRSWMTLVMDAVTGIATLGERLPKIKESFPVLRFAFLLSDFVLDQSE